MATNPMQRRARNSFLLGMFVMLLITGIIIGVLAFLLVNEKKENEKQQKESVSVCVLNKDIKSGTELTTADIVYEQTTVTENGKKQTKLLPKRVDSALSPLNAATEQDLISTVAKIDLKAGTILTTDMLTTAEDVVQNDTRIQEFNMLILPVKLNVDDFIDIRLTLPNGLEYIVLAKKRVMDIVENTIWLRVSEEELLTMSNAIVEAYKMTGAKLTATLYIEPGMQEAATPTYVVSQEIYSLIQGNPNIVTAAKKALADRYNANGMANQRQTINSSLGQYEDQAQANLEQKVQEETEARKELRQKYLDQLSIQTTTSK